MAHPGLFFIYFRSFKTLFITIFTTALCEKMTCPSSLQRWDLNTQPLERDPPPITVEIIHLFRVLVFT